MTYIVTVSEMQCFNVEVEAADKHSAQVMVEDMDDMSLDEYRVAGSDLYQKDYQVRVK